MAPPKTYRAEALSLKKMPLGEADLLLTFYTRETGKLRAVAKGARRTTSKLVGHFEPLTLNRLSLSKGRTLDIVSQAQVLENFGALKGNLNSLTQGLYVAELLDGFGSEANPNPELFQLSLDTLQVLAQPFENELPLRYFELHLLRTSGLLPELYHCVECRKTLEPGSHRFSQDQGGTLCLECRPADSNIRNLSLPCLKVLRLLHRTPLHELPNLNMNQAISLELKSLLAATVHYWLDKEIRTNSFLEHLQRLPDSPVYS